MKTDILGALAVTRILDTKFDDLNDVHIRDLYDLLKHHPGVAGKIMFPTKPVGYVRSTKDIANYLINRYIAHLELDLNSIDTAGQYADIAEHIYNKLEAYAQNIIR